MTQRQELFSIGEITRAAGVTRRMILNYEERGLICPDIKKGDAGNRYYTIDTFTKIRNIRILQDLGLSLDEIRGYYDDSIDLLPMIRRLEKLRDQLNLNIEKLYERTSVVPPQVRKLQLQSQLVYRKSYRSDSIKEKTVLLRNTALEAMRAYGTDSTRRMSFIEYSINAPLEAAFCVAVPPGSKGEFVTLLPPTDVLSIYHHGAYENLPTVGQRLLEYAAEHHFSPRGTLRHIYLEGPPQHKDPSKFITQVVLPIEDADENMAGKYKMV